MGINCISCINGRTIKSEIPVEMYKNSYFLKKIKKIQSNYRGYVFRKIYFSYIRMLSCCFRDDATVWLG